MKTLCLITAIAIYSLSLPVYSAVEDGEAIFNKRCHACHKLPDPNHPPKEGWPKRLDMMAPMAGLKKEQKKEVLEYLLSHSKDVGKKAMLADDRAFFEAKCSYCHGLERVFLIPFNEESRRHVVKRMQNRAGPDWISDADAERILSYLATATPQAQPTVHLDSNNGRDILKTRCTACHTLERIFVALDEYPGNADLWPHIVSRMRSKAPQWISEYEAQSIIDYLQTLVPQNK
ncbi:MAG: hypothetical protein IIB68_10170 [Proteobacteria bacterium]|nr:hypothetical protein [Pseudomonadota bacterium]